MNQFELVFSGCCMSSPFFFFFSSCVFSCTFDVSFRGRLGVEAQQTYGSVLFEQQPKVCLRHFRFPFRLNSFHCVIFCNIEHFLIYLGKKFEENYAERLPL